MKNLQKSQGKNSDRIQESFDLHGTEKEETESGCGGDSFIGTGTGLEVAILSVSWHPTDPFTLLTGLSDGSVNIWGLSIPAALLLATTQQLDRGEKMISEKILPTTNRQRIGTTASGDVIPTTVKLHRPECAFLDFSGSFNKPISLVRQVTYHY